MFINSIITKVYKSPFNFPKKQLYRSDKYTRDLGPDCMLSELANIAFIIVERKSLFNKTLIFELRIVICRIKEKVVITMARIEVPPNPKSLLYSILHSLQTSYISGPLLQPLCDLYSFSTNLNPPLEPRSSQTDQPTW